MRGICIKIDQYNLIRINVIIYISPTILLRKRVIEMHAQLAINTDYYNIYCVIITSLLINQHAEDTTYSSMQGDQLQVPKLPPYVSML